MQEATHVYRIGVVIAENTSAIVSVDFPEHSEPRLSTDSLAYLAWPKAPRAVSVFMGATNAVLRKRADARLSYTGRHLFVPLSLCVEFLRTYGSPLEGDQRRVTEFSGAVWRRVCESIEKAQAAALERRAPRPQAATQV